jgi:raffinose/stachyose/melibiose transport system substrate-binding protein
MKNRWFAIGILLLVGGFAFAGGTGEMTQGTEFEIAVSATEEGQIAVYETVFQELIDSYNEENGTDFTLNLVSGQGMDIMNTRMSSNDPPDVFTIDSPADVNQYNGDGLVLDLTEYARDAGWESRIFDWAYSLAQVDGRVVSLPYGYEGMVIWYNKSIMAELGLDATEIDTLPEFEAALETAKDAEYIPIMLGSQDWPWAQEWYLSILYSYTGRDRVKATVEGQNGFSWTDQAFVDTVELYKSWHDAGYLADSRSYILTSTDAINAFTNDRALFKLEGTWAPYWIVPLEPEQRDNIGVMLHPAINNIEEPHLPLAVGGMWCASAETEYPDLAAYVLTGLLDEKYQDEFLGDGMDIAPIELDSEYFEGLIPTVESMWNLVNTALAQGSFGYTTWAFYPPETRVYAYEGVVNVFEDNISVEEYLTEMQRLNEKELQNGFVPVIPAAN